MRRDIGGLFYIWDSFMTKQVERMSARFLKELGLTLTSERCMCDLSWAWNLIPTS